MRRSYRQLAATDVDCRILMLERDQGFVSPKDILKDVEMLRPEFPLLSKVSLDYKQRLQQLFFPQGIAFGGNRFKRTAVTAPLFSYLAPFEGADERVVTLNFASWNQLDGWLRQIDGLRGAA